MSKLVSNFKEANKKLIILKESEKLLKDPKKPSAHHTQKVLIEFMNFQKYLSRDVRRVSYC